MHACFGCLVNTFHPEGLLGFLFIYQLIFLCLDNDYDLSYRRHSFTYFFRSEKTHFKVFSMAF